MLHVVCISSIITKSFVAQRCYNGIFTLTSELNGAQNSARNPDLRHIHVRMLYMPPDILHQGYSRVLIKQQKVSVHIKASRYMIRGFLWKWIIGATVWTTCLWCYNSYYSGKAPITGRKRYGSVTKAKEQQISAALDGSSKDVTRIVSDEDWRASKLQDDDPRCACARDILDRLLEAAGLSHLPWKLDVRDSKGWWRSNVGNVQEV